MKQRFSIAVASFGAVALLALLVPPLRQDPAYHDFADQRQLWGWPHFWNVVSNGGFAAAGLAGLIGLRYRPGQSWERRAVVLLFAAVAATSVGSGYYHWAPSNATLFWDRLPMAVAFMALFALVTGERTVPEAGKLLLAPMVAAGVASVGWWRAYDDLRFYALVQFVPLVVIPVLLWRTRGAHRGAGELVGALAWYAGAKLLEAADGPVYRVTGLSGHTLKHIAAGLSCWWLVRWMIARVR
jgi:hypothetical protein